jgi:hypothetical protein
MIRIGKSSAVYCLTLILIPGALLMSLLRRRKLDWLVGIGVLVGCGSLGFGLTFGHAEGDTHMRIGRWVLAVAQLPVILLFYEPIRQVSLGRWRRAVGWLIAFLPVSAALASIILLYYAANSFYALQPSEKYSTAGWYTIGLWGAYLTGVMMLVVAVGRSVLRAVQRYRERCRLVTHG